MSVKQAFSVFKDMRPRDWLLLALAAICLMLLFTSETDGGGATDTEARMERVLEKIDGAGDVRVMVTETDGGYSGVLVVCEGARDLAVRLTVQNAVHTLLGIDNQKINVVPMEDKQ